VAATFLAVTTPRCLGCGSGPHPLAQSAYVLRVDPRQDKAELKVFAATLASLCGLTLIVKLIRRL
jgi:hypothetical protein